jgi:hypothetical protein
MSHHCQYDCCAICDGKIQYQGYEDATHKVEVCGDCQAGLCQFAVEVETYQDLIHWMEFEDPRDVYHILSSLNFEVCRYDTKVDEIWVEVLRQNGQTVPD